MDITYFIKWFVSQVIKIFTFVFNTLDSIKFMGTSLLSFIINILIISALITVILTINQVPVVIGSKSEQIKTKKEMNSKSQKKSKGESRWI